MANMIKIFDSRLQDFSVNYYSHARECILKFVNSSYERRSHGEYNPVIKDELTGEDFANNFHYLFALLVMAYYEYSKDGMTEAERELFYTNYRIDEIKEKFMCFGCDVTILIEEFLAIYMLPDTPPTNPVDHEGIGFDIIEDTLTIS